MGTFSYLGKQNETIIKMYCSARQFRNAIKFEDILEIENGIFQNRVFPYIVNCAFSCEVYLKMIIKSNGASFDKMHKIKDLLDLAGHRELFELYFFERNGTTGDVDDISRLENDLESISNAFTNWRYIYERDCETAAVGTLRFLNDYLDQTCKAIIESKYNVDMDKYPFI